jgi:ORF6N domain
MARRRVGVPADRIRQAILLVRGQRVMLDADLGTLYGVPTRALIQAVRRNRARFPADFMFRLIVKEVTNLRSQIVISSSSRGWGGRRYAPHAFTEQGVAMLSSVLRSPCAIEVNIAIMRAFVRLRRMLLSHEALARKLDALEKKYDTQFKAVFDVIRELMSPQVQRRPAIGFRPRPREGSEVRGARGPSASRCRAAADPPPSPRSRS